jgi:branched-chain amino acid transport system permease protein
MEILILAIIYAQFAASWDLLSGFTDQDSFGHAFFIGGTAYLSALLGQWLDWSPWITAPAASIIAALIGSLIGAMTLRLRGPYFALSTIAIAVVLYKLAYVLSGMTGGEEGLSGLRSFTDGVNTDLLTCVVIFTISFLGMQLLCRSRYGLILRSTKHNEDAAQASGINTAYYKVLAFTLSGFLAGLGGAMYGHTQMQVNPELLAGSLSVMIVLIAIVGGRGTIAGPAIAAIVLTVLDEWLRIIDQYRGVIFTAMLIALVYANPAGFANSRFLSRYGRLRRLLFGSPISA